jgi:hypothetical protein
MRLLDAAPLFSKRADIGSDIAGFISAQREIGHFRMRIEQKEREPLGVEIRFVCYRRERWNICTRRFLCAVNDVTRSAPALCEVCTVICIGCHRRRQDQTKHASNNKQMFENGCEQLILGSGQMGNVHLSPEAEAYFAKKGCTVLLQPTPKAIHTFNNSHAKKIGLFHVTC